MRTCRRFMRRRPPSGTAAMPLVIRFSEYVWKVPTSGSSPALSSASQPSSGTTGSWMCSTS